MTELLTLDEVAVQLSLSEAGVLRLMDEGQLKATSDQDSAFGRLAFARADVDAYLQRRSV